MFYQKNLTIKIKTSSAKEKETPKDVLCIKQSQLLTCKEVIKILLENIIQTIGWNSYGREKQWEAKWAVIWFYIILS